MEGLVRDHFSKTIQAFPLVKSLINITSGSTDGVYLFHCIADGSITITWADASTVTVACLAGDDYTVVNGEDGSVEVDSGTFHLVK